MPGDPGFIDPNRLYTLRGFYNDSGVSPTRVREARQAGIELSTLDMGKRKFVRGHIAIQFIEKLAEANGTTVPDSQANEA